MSRNTFLGVLAVAALILVGVLLALCSIGGLIFFIHHVPSKIHINSVIEDVGDRLLRSVDDRFPRFVGEAPSDHQATLSDVPVTFRKGADAEEGRARRAVQAKATGYIQFLDDEALMRLARKHDLVLRLQYQPGDFVHIGRALMEVSPPTS